MSPIDSAPQPSPAVTPTEPESPPAGRRAGYVAAIVVNLVLLWIVHHLLDWDWPRFLTDEFDDVLPVLTASIIATIVANAVFVVFDPPWFRHLANVVTSAIALACAVVVSRVFPFDFSDYATDWTWLARLVVVVGVVGTAVAVVVNTVSLVLDVARAGRSSPGRRATTP
jgi:hypothetical protein